MFRKWFGFVWCQTTRSRSFHASSCRCDAVVINGNKLAQEIKDEVSIEVETRIRAGHRPPHLSVVLVGDDAASRTYVRNKIKAAKSVGITSETIRKDTSISQDELLAVIKRLNEDNNVDGILVQLPIPRHISERKICNMVAPHKDVDGFHIVNVGRFCLDMHSILPCTPAGVMEILKRTGIKTRGKNAVVCGRSKNVGMPIAMLLHADGVGETGAMDATTIICHRYTPRSQLSIFTRHADIIVTATGVPNLIQADMIKEGACVIDVGISRIREEITGKTKLVGDVDFEGVAEKASYITPVPGGVGPMTVAMLMKNTLTAAKADVCYNGR